jgi:SAM-dependent methyltransferase
MKKICMIFLRLIFFLGKNIFPYNESLKMTSTQENEIIHYDKVGIDSHVDFLKVYGLSGYDLVADIGSGNGRWLHAFNRLGSISVGVEPRKDGIRQAIHRLSYSEGWNAHMIQGSAEFVPLKNEHFDLYYSYGVLMYCNLDCALQEARRILKSNGSFFMVVQGPGYPLIRINHGLISRDYAQFYFGCKRLYLSIKSLILPSLFNTEEPTAIPQKVFRQKLKAIGLQVEDYGELNFRNYRKILTFPISYYLRGKNAS